MTAKITSINRATPRTELTEDELKRTRWFFGKPYHWTLNEEGFLSLAQGPTEYEDIRWKVVEKLIDKGVDPESITAEMINAVVAKAETAYIMEEVTQDAED